MGRSKGTQKKNKIKWQTKFASKHQKLTWPQTSFWTPKSQSLLLPSSLTSVSLVAASALEESIEFIKTFIWIYWFWFNEFVLLYIFSLNLFNLMYDSDLDYTCSYWCLNEAYYVFT